MGLISLSDLEGKLGRSTTTDEQSTFTVLNSAMQAEVEAMIGSDLEVATEATRYYDGGVQHLKIDPCTNVASIKLYDDDQVVVDTYDTSDYTVEPVNKTLKTMIRHRSGALTNGINNIGVTAKFSINADAKILGIVKNAMLEALVSELENNDNIKRESIEGYSVEFATTEAKNALASIKYLFPEII